MAVVEAVVIVVAVVVLVVVVVVAVFVGLGNALHQVSGTSDFSQAPHVWSWEQGKKQFDDEP